MKPLNLPSTVDCLNGARRSFMAALSEPATIMQSYCGIDILDVQSAEKLVIEFIGVE